MSVAKRYTRALYETLRAGNGSSDSMGKYKSELLQVASAIDATREARVALYGPVVSTRDKLAVIKAICEKAKTSQTITNFLLLLARKDRLGILPEAVVAFDEIVAEAEGALLGEVVSADPLSDADTEQLVESFERKLGKKVRFRVKTDPSLIAGVKVTVNGVTYDGSLKAQINRLKETFIQGSAALH